MKTQQQKLVSEHFFNCLTELKKAMEETDKKLYPGELYGIIDQVNSKIQSLNHSILKYEERKFQKVRS